MTQNISYGFGETYVNHGDDYPGFERNMKAYFDKAIHGNKPLFQTDTKSQHDQDLLYDLFLGNLPEAARQHYTCNACRRFISRYGNLVTIDEVGNVKSAIWDPATTPVFFREAVQDMKLVAERSKVTNVFIPDEKTLGTPKTGVWTHLAVHLPASMTNRNVLRNAHQVMAARREEFNMFRRALEEYTPQTVETALTMIRSESMYRAERVLPIAEWFQVVQNHIRNVPANKRDNLIWLTVATAPTGFTHVRSSMIGTLLDDIAAGMSMASVASRFAEKMNPSNFMRSQVAPSASGIQQAEKVVKQLGLESALKRRYAQFGEIPNFLWQNRRQAPVATQSGIFGHVEPKKAEAKEGVRLPSAVMTWEKFQRTVLPTADGLEVLMDNPNRFMAMVTASDNTAQNLFQWDNPFSWYYHGGIDGEIKRRVEQAGGRYENNEIRASLIWENYTDLDIHCVTPAGRHIYFGDKVDARSGGNLDIDMNAGGRQSKEPVENIRFADNAPEGRYRFYIHNFSDRNNGQNPYKVELEVAGKIYTVHGNLPTSKSSSDAFVFDYKRGEEPRFITGGNATTSNPWGAAQNDFVKVNGITTSPNTWGERPVPQAGTHIFFLLDDVKDSSEGKGRGFFNEMLKGELREIRKTLEAYTAATPIEELDNATACGVGYTKDNEWNLTVKVHQGSTTRVIKIDRWD